MKKQEIKLVCPLCHYIDVPTSLTIEVVFSNVGFTFKCKNCKEEVRIFVPLKEFGSITYEKVL